VTQHPQASPGDGATRRRPLGSFARLGASLHVAGTPAPVRRAGRVPVRLCALALGAAFALLAFAATSALADPVPTVNPVSEHTITTANVTGSITPDSAGETIYSFQYTEAGKSEWISPPPPRKRLPRGSVRTAVEEDLAGLRANTSYEVRLDAFPGPIGVDFFSAPSPIFTTNPAPNTPTVALEPASASYVSAHIQGTVDPEGGNLNAPGEPVPIHWAIELSETGEPETFFAVSEGDIAGPEAEESNPVAVSADPGLPQNTTFHYRLRANYASQQVLTSDATFKTLFVAKPTTTIKDASEASYITAHASGTVEIANEDPAFSASCEFQYATEADFSNAAAVACEPPTIFGSEAQPVSVTATLTGLQPATTYYLRLLATNAGGQGEAIAPDTFKTLFVAAPAVTIDPLTTFTATTAHLTGTVNPEGADPAFNSSCRFDYVTQGTFEASGFEGAPSVPCEPNPVEGAGAQAVKADLTGLVPHTTYHLRLVAANAGGTSDAIAAETLITKVQAPLISSTSSANITADSADLRAQLNPGGGATTYHFDYGTTASSYEHSTAESGSIDSDNSEHQASAHITGLEPETTYHFRIVATNSASPSGGTLGPDRTFTTQPAISSTALPDGRQWELVSPPDKHGAEVEDRFFIFGGVMQASEDGEAVTYITNAPVSANALTSPIENQVLSRRDPAGWSSQDIATPHANASASEFTEAHKPSDFIRINEFAEYWAFSPDLSLAYVEPEATTPLAPPAPAPERVLEKGNTYNSGYVRDNATGTYTVTKQNSKEWYDEQVALSAPPPKCDASTSPVGGTVGNEGVQAVSQDGCYVYFNSEAGAGPLEVAHYDGTAWSTTLISSLLGPGTLRWGTNGFTELSPNGRYLTFMSDQSLTGYDNTDANSPLGEPRADEEVFLYDAASKTLTCPSCDPTGARPVGQYDINLQGGIQNFYVGGKLQVDPTAEWAGHWLAGLLAPTPPVVYSLAAVDPAFNHQPRYLTDSGELFFESPVALVPQDVNGTWDVYEYRPQGTGGCAMQAGCVALISSGQSSDESVLIEASADGSDIFFFTSERLSGQDVDNVNDVYDAHLCSAEVPCPPPPPPPAPACEGDACQQPAVPPNHPTPGTSLLNGPENEHLAKPKKRKSKHHKKRGHGKPQKRAANANRRAGK
jgi:hypothetical protein